MADEKEIFNATGYPMWKDEAGKCHVKRPEIGDIISVNTGAGSDKMRVDYFQDGYIFCECDGIERTIALRVRDNVLLFVDVTD
jgi:hypothetical protein